MKLKKEQTVALAIGLAAAAFTLSIYFVFLHGVAGKPGNVVMKLMAQGYRKTLPRMIDKDTELDSVDFDDKTFIYVNRFVAYLAKDIPPGFEDRVKPKLAETLCATASTRDGLLDKGITLRYRYYDKDMVFVGTVDVRPGDCGMK